MHPSPFDTFTKLSAKYLNYPAIHFMAYVVETQYTTSLRRFHFLKNQKIQSVLNRMQAMRLEIFIQEKSVGKTDI
jgi:hypothetical protein